MVIIYNGPGQANTNNKRRYLVGIIRFIFINDAVFAKINLYREKRWDRGK